MKSQTCTSTNFPSRRAVSFCYGLPTKQVLSVPCTTPSHFPRLGRMNGVPLITTVVKAASTLTTPVKPVKAGVETEYALTVILQGARDYPLRIKLQVVDEDNDQNKSAEIDLAKGTFEPYKRSDAVVAGTIISTRINLPDDFKPGVILLQKYPEDNPDSENPPFVATIKLEASGATEPLYYTPYTYIDLHQKTRVIFPSSQAYPGFKSGTPKGLQTYRTDELKAFRGDGDANVDKMRQGSQRIYGWDVYNDLGDPSKPDTTRPVLGGKHLKYPRRLRTGRKTTPDGMYELAPDKNKLPWLPLDERFNSVKNHAFNGDAAGAEGSAARSVLGTPRGISFVISLIPFIHKMFSNNVDPTKPRTLFTSLQIVDALYHDLVGESEIDKEAKVFEDLLPVTRLGTIQLLNLVQDRFKQLDDGLKTALGLPKDDAKFDEVMEEAKARARSRQAVGPTNPLGKIVGGFLRALGSLFAHKGSPPPPTAPAAAPAPAAASDDDDEGDAERVGEEGLGDKVDDALGLVRGLLEKWPVPNVRLNRATQWRSDEEFGRSALEGQNPLSIRAVTKDDLDKKFAVSDKDVAGLLEGKTLAESLGEGRLWVLDFYDGYKQYIDLVSDLEQARVLYAGRCLLYTRDDEVTVPVAIELETAGEKLRVFSPINNSQEVWFLAKTVISSLDSGIHQLISHWLRTHACVEPYVIATQRYLSALNPVYKLLRPHFRYTLRINCNARKTLVSAGGIVEQGFTPERYSMELSSVVYNSWRFDQQSLPADLLHRGVAEKGPDGKLKIKLPQYSYAEDGIMLYEAIESFVSDYLKAHYDDKTPGKKVTDDDEVTDWWKAVQEEGHPDAPKDSWPEITDITSLAQVLASIMWTASCHHAAVNFGQYDNSAYMPYKPSKICAKIPKLNSPEEEALKNRFESSLLSTVTDPVGTLALMVTLKILSSHAADEEYLDKEEHNYIKDPAGVAAHQAFVKALQEAEGEIEKRNATPSRLRNGRGLPYTLLMPSNPNAAIEPGAKPVPRGIPYSISI